MAWYVLSAQLMSFISVVLVFISWRREKHPTAVFKSSPKAWSPVSQSVQLLSHVQLFVTPWIAAHQTSPHQTSLSITNFQSLLNPCPSSRWCHPTISSSVAPVSSCPQSLQASGSFPMSQLFTWGDQSIGVSASASVLPKNIQDWSPLRWTGWTSLQSKGLSRVFSNTIIQKHQFFGTPWWSPVQNS